MLAVGVGRVGLAYHGAKIGVTVKILVVQESPLAPGVTVKVNAALDVVEKLVVLAGPMTFRIWLVVPSKQYSPYDYTTSLPPLVWQTITRSMYHGVLVRLALNASELVATVTPPIATVSAFVPGETVEL